MCSLLPWRESERYFFLLSPWQRKVEMGGEGLVLSPLTPITMGQGVGGLWTPGLACRIVGEIARRQRLPDVQNRHSDVPRRLDEVVTLEQRGITNHRVVQ